MQRLCILAFSVLIGISIFQTIQLNNMKRESKDLRESHRVNQEELSAMTEDVIDYIKRFESEARSLDKRLDDLEFKQRNIQLDYNTQEYIFYESLKNGVNPDIIYAIMENESGFQDVGVIVDSNGLPSAGRMQINSPNWEWLMNEYGIDVHDDEGNIRAGIVILAKFLDKYPLEKALVCYECGEAGAEGISSTSFSRKIINRSREIKEAVL